VGGLIEYNISSLLAIGAKVQYRLQNKDNFEGTNLKEEAGGYNFKGVTNDNIALTALSLRWKIGAKNKNHIRNNETRITLGDVFTLANRANTKTDSLAQELDKLKLSLQPGPDDDGDGVPNSRDWEPNTPKGLYIDYNGRGIPEIKVIPETKEIYPKDIQYMRASTKDEDKDGVPDNRDKEPNSPKNQCVDFWGRSITQDKPCAFASVYFDFDKTNLDEEALIEIEKLVEKLSSDPTLLVEIRGYTDNVGSNKYNRRLSQERSNRVKAELVFTHNIDPQRIISNGMGKIPQPPTAYRMNRRCDFILSK
ncbi:MAG TPA: OmpA family protein, partial [Paludibacteraceae bacterium]|nr:OmpA family protein [Paludibacteraceae bacterium]